MISIKAKTQEQMSSAVLVSFADKWKYSIENRCIEMVIRKRVPNSYLPKWMYFHVNAPVGQICARAEISDIKKISLQDALEMRQKIGLSADEIEKYLGKDKYIGCYFLTKIETPRNICKSITLKNIMDYNPPQSFLYMSIEGKRIIDDICDFHRV